VNLAIIVMGVSGSGKTSVGELLAERLGWPFYDADGFHPKENVAKMSSGQPLNDKDREPWLSALNQLISKNLREGTSLVLACSALKEKYRQHLAKGHEKKTKFVYLEGSFETIYTRMQSRDHFMKPSMLRSQFDTLEEPKDAITVDIRKSQPEIVDDILRHPVFHLEKSQ
jgi:carbohydrate kinase (thermoresistant glucokinase family)